MASKKSGGLKLSQTKKLIGDLNTEVNNLNTALREFKNDLDEMQKGDGTSGTSYWSGQRAYNWISKALQHYDRNRVLQTKIYGCIGVLDGAYNSAKNK